MARIGIVTVSDRASRGDYEDRGGPAIRQYLSEVLVTPWEPIARLIEDDQPTIEVTLRELAELACGLIVTTGGTGPALRDVTPGNPVRSPNVSTPSSPRSLLVST